MAKILLVEDNEMNRDMLSRRLTKRGYEVVIAVDGQQGLDLAAGKEKPNLILLDMSLPVIDGWEAARRLKADPATLGIPIIALTAHAMAGDREKCLEAGYAWPSPHLRTSTVGRANHTTSARRPGRCNECS